MIKPSVVLIHGLFLNPIIMRYVKAQLEEDYQVESFGYPTTRHSIEDNAKALTQFICTKNLETPHLVGHSLGGLLIRKAFEINPLITCGRVVTLGTPHQGSAVARVIHNLSNKILRQSYCGALDGALPDWSGQAELGSIAGNVAFGIGQIIELEKPNDGTVTVRETQLPGMKDHIVLPCSHTTMLYSTAVCQQIKYFLAHGQFDHRSL